MYSYNRRNRKVVRQELHWVAPPAQRKTTTRAAPRPDRLWVLVNEQDKEAKPKLPFKVISNVNAILEMADDDWHQNRDGTIEVSGRTELGGIGYWVLLEWLEE